MTIEQRAEAYASNGLEIEPGTIQYYRQEGYIAGATEERALMEQEKAEPTKTLLNLFADYVIKLPIIGENKEIYIKVDAAIDIAEKYASQQTAPLEARVKELEEENATLKRKLKIAENTYWNELE